MKRCILLTLLLAVAAAAQPPGGSQYPADSVIFDDAGDLQTKFDDGELGGAGGGAALPGVSGGTATDTTVGAIYTMGSFSNLPRLQPYYVSVTNDASDPEDWPVGDDDNPGTIQRPLKTIWAAANIVRGAGQFHVILDPRDTWDMSDIAHVGGPSITSTMTFTASSDTIELDNGWTWTGNLVGMGNGLGRIEVSGTTGGTLDGTYTVASWSGDTITVNEDIASDDISKADVTVQQYYDELKMTKGCTDTYNNAVVCGAISGGDFTGLLRPTFDCSNMDSTHPFGKATTSLGFIINDVLTVGPDHGWLVVQNIRLNDCPKQLAGNQDLLRVNRGGGMAMLNVTCIDVKGDNNQCFTTHGTGPSVMVNMSCTTAVNSGSDSQCYFVTNGQDHLFVGNRALEVRNTAGTSGQDWPMVFHQLQDDTPVRALVIGPTLQSTGGGSGVSEAGLKLLGNGEGDYHIDVAYTTIRGFDETECDGKGWTTNASLDVDVCSSGVRFIRAADAGRVTNNRIRGYRNTYYENRTHFYMQGINAEDTFMFNDVCSIYEDAVADTNNDAFVMNLAGQDHSTGTVDFNIRESIYDSDDGAQQAFILNFGTMTEYDTQAAAVAGGAQGENLTAFFADGDTTPTDGSQTWDSAGIGTAGNQFCSRKDLCDANKIDLRKRAACATDYNLGITQRTECSQACDETVLWDTPPNVALITEVLFGVQIDDWQLGTSGLNTNVGAR